MSVIPQIWRQWMRPRARGTSLEYVADSWQLATDRMAVRGWNAESVVKIQAELLEDWQRLPRSTEPLGSGLSSTTNNLSLHNSLVSFAYVAALAAHHRERLTMLDWGGGAGQYGWLAKSVLPDLIVDYFCKDVPVQCAAGRQTYPQGTFFSSDDDFRGHRFDLVFASGSLHYVVNWQEVLGRLAAATDRYLFVTRLPVVMQTPSHVVLQRAYQSEYLGWTLNRNEFLAAASALGLKLVREFLLGESHFVRGAPEMSCSCGFLFRPGK